MKLILHAFALLLTLSAFCQHSMVKTAITDDISIEVPDNFINMSQSERVRKFVSAREPLAMYTSDERNADLGINRNIMQWKTGDTQTIYGFYKASIQSLFDDIEFIQDTIRTVNGREFIIFEFVSSLRNDNTFSNKGSAKNYTYIQYTSYKDQVLLFNFGCRGRLANQWKATAKEIMESVKIKD